ncbi:hypothetical protein ABZ920_11435 [Streptomyces sp. NPDC046831]|uniref:hypothetical protein n=1 Tax=Streptomyces sp. NPDC046831 TaxID=3154805 RepID=UPI00340631FE
MSAPRPRTARSGSDLRVLRAAVFAAVCVVLAAAGHALASCATVPLWTVGAAFLGALVVVAPLAGRERSLPGIAALLAVGQIVLHTLFGLGQHGATAMASGGTSPQATGPAGSAGAAGGLHGMSDASLVEQAARLVCGTTAAAISPAQAYRILSDAHVHAAAVPPGGTRAQHADALSAAGAPASLLPSLPMLLGHVLAAIAAGWLLRRGDLALLRLIRLSAHGVAETALVRSLRAALALVRALCAGLPAGPPAGPRLWPAAHCAPPLLRGTALQHTVVRRGPPAAGALVLAA